MRNRARYGATRRRKILLELRHCFTEEEVCDRWGISRAELNRWKKAFDYDVWSVGNLRDMILGCVYGEPATAEGIADHCGYLSHSGYAPREIMEELLDLQSDGFVLQHEDGKWAYNTERLKSNNTLIF